MRGMLGAMDFTLTVTHIASSKRSTTICCQEHLSRVSLEDYVAETAVDHETGQFSTSPRENDYKPMRGIKHPFLYHARVKRCLIKKDST
jgi:hypothetical protein